MMTAEIRQVSDTTFIARGDTNHWVVMDDQRQFGGSEAGSDPMEMLLFSLGGCMGMWLDVLLRKPGCPWKDPPSHRGGTGKRGSADVYEDPCGVSLPR